jgi:mannose-1-phosphate guanylyltransferase
MSAMLPALVLSAGLGTRLDPLTRIVAKPAVPLAGRPLIVRVLEWLREQDVTHVVINLHHRPETITREVGDGAHLGLRVRYSWEQPLLGSAGGPRHALPLIDAEAFAIVNGDSWCPLDLRALETEHRRQSADVTLAVTAHPAPNRYSGVVTDADGRVTGFIPRGPDAAGSSHFVGVQIVRAGVFASLADGTPAESVGGLYRARLADGWTGLRASPTGAPALDLGTPGDYLAAALALSDRPGTTIVEPGAEVAPSARLLRTIVWPGARVGADAAIEDCVVATGADVPAGFTARRAVLVAAELVQPDDRAEVRDGVAVFPMAVG